MSTITSSAAHPPSPPTKHSLSAIDSALSVRSTSPYLTPDHLDLDLDSELSPLEDEFCDPIDFMGEEDARGDHLPPTTTHDTTAATTTATADFPAQSHYPFSPNPTPDTDYDGHRESATDHFTADDSNTSLNLPPLPDNDDSSLLPVSEDGDYERPDNQTYLEENEMRRKLMDMESSFLPEPSTIEVAGGANPTTGTDDTYLFGVPGEAAAGTASRDDVSTSFVTPDESSYDVTSNNDAVPILRTPDLNPGEDPMADMDATPAAHPERHDDTTIFENVPSSPTAQAAARTGGRVPSIVSQDLQDTSRTSYGDSTDRSTVLDADQSLQSVHQRVRSSARSTSPGQSRLFSDNGSANDGADAASRASSRRSNRPKYLTSRQSVHRYSYSSMTSGHTEVTNSDATLGADYTLQSGGATPGTGDPTQHEKLARSISLGSMASGISGYSEENPFDKGASNGQPVDGGLHTLDEEKTPSHSRPTTSQQDPPPSNSYDELSGPMTPKAKSQDNTFPTDTVLAERVKDVQVPSTFVKQFREDFGGRGSSPDKRAGATPAFARSGRTMTLKEQSSTIDRLSKENFDLKMRIHFLNEALNRRSEEGIKEMISENVELKSDKLKLQKDSQSLKRKIRDLEKQLKDQQSDKDSMVNHDPEGGASDEDERDPAQDEEMLYLRERVETYELEIERLRYESLARETEKRRLAEMVKSLSDGRPMSSDAGAREERDMWKDMLDAEAAAREQAEEENKRLRDEALRLRSEMSYAVVPARTGTRDRVGSLNSFSGMSDKEIYRHTTTGSSSSSTLVMELELLKQENAELRKEVSAQTSMLTSRNREKERLYQEIEEMKLGQRRDGTRSIADDSIFDRSASRAHGRPSSRDSDGTGPTANDEADREDLEMRNGQLRDQVSNLKLENQDVRTQLDDYMAAYESLDNQYQEDVDHANEEIQGLQQERDQALQMAEERDAAFQDLRAEAQDELDAIGEELDQKVEDCQRLEEELRNQDENLQALQAEMRAASEGILRLEEDAQNNLHRYHAVQQELEDSNREMESLEKDLYEANTKVQRLTVQIESSQNEIAFLREEQDGDKIKIGDLESELKTYQVALRSEKDKTRELEDRLAEERHQREVVGSKEKQEVQRIVNELNRESTAAKEEVRKLRKSLSAQEIETATWRDRLMDLENNLRETLGDLTGSRSGLISNIMKLQKELESTALELESIRSKLGEKESLLRNRDALLESHGLESQKLAELLERERHGRRADKQSFEQALKSHQHASRTITQNNSRISELESARSQDRKRFTGLEQQFRDQLNERNTMLLDLWKRLSAMCGPDWTHSNSLINGNLPSQEVIGNILFWPGFRRNLLLAVKMVENVISGFKNRIKGVERDLTKQYQTVEHSYGLRIKKLDRLEESMLNMRAQHHAWSQSGISPEISKLRGENRLLKAELNLVQSHPRSRGPATAAAVAATTGSPRAGLESGGSAERASLVRHQSMTERSTETEGPRPDRGLARSSTSGIPQPSHVSSTTTLAEGPGSMVHGTRARSGPMPGETGNNEKWVQRLHELEKRLKAEREARLLDRNGARKRLEERDVENQRLRAQLERQRLRKEISNEGSDDKMGRIQGPPPNSTSHVGRHRDEEPSSSEGEGIYVDIEV